MTTLPLLRLASQPSTAHTGRGSTPGNRVQPMWVPVLAPTLAFQLEAHLQPDGNERAVVVQPAAEDRGTYENRREYVQVCTWRARHGTMT